MLSLSRGNRLRPMSESNESSLRMSSAMPKVPRPPPPSSLAVTAVMKANRPRDTGPEIRLRRALWSLGERGYRVAPRGVPGRPDIVYTRERLAVFVHGCFWHQHGCSRSGGGLPKSNRWYWKTKFRLNRERDERKVRELENHGWRVLVIWECEVRANPLASAQRISDERGTLHSP